MAVGGAHRRPDAAAAAVAAESVPAQEGNVPGGPQDTVGTGGHDQRRACSGFGAPYVTKVILAHRRIHDPAESFELSQKKAVGHCKIADSILAYVLLQ